MAIFVAVRVVNRAGVGQIEAKGEAFEAGLLCRGATEREDDGERGGVDCRVNSHRINPVWR